MAEEPELDFRDFDAPDVVYRLSSEKQRYGHTTDVSSLLGSAEESNDYLVGLVIAAVIVIIIFSVFMLAIAVLWCCGRNNVGFLSGAPFQVPRHLSNNRREGGNSVTSENGFNSPTKQQHDSAQEHGNESDQNDGSTKRLLVRGTFVLSGIIFILFSILLCTQGITNLQDAVESVNESSTDVKNLSTDANTIITDGFVSVQSLATTLRDSIQSELQAESFCPLHPEFGAVGDIEVVRAQADEAVQKLDGLGSFLSGEIEGLTAAIGDVEKGALQVEQQTEKIDLTDWEILLILIPFTIVPCVLVTGAILAHFDVHFPLLNCFINWFFLPLFIVMVIVCIGTSSAMIAVASGNSDFCLPGGRTSDTYDGDSPDSTVYRMMDRSGYTINSGDLVRAVTDYYVEQCINVTNPYGFITDYIPDLNESKISVEQFRRTLDVNDTLVQLEAYCGREFDTLLESMGQMTKTVDSLIAAIAAGLDLISCRRIVPIYHQSIYDGACIYSVSALFWVFAAALINGFFGLLMVLFRASYKPNRYIYPDLAEKDMGHEITYEESRPHQVNDFEADEVYSPQPNRRYDYEDEDETLTPQKPHANVY